MWCPNRECPDFVEDGRPGEYVDTVVTCPKCGATLVPEWPPAPAPAHRVRREDLEPGIEGADATAAAAASLPERLVAIAAFDYPDETEPIMLALIAKGITVFQFLDDGRDFQDQQGLATCTRLLVPESQAALALSLLE
jgi:hypothetical protein